MHLVGFVVEMNYKFLTLMVQKVTM